MPKKQGKLAKPGKGKTLKHYIEEMRIATVRDVQDKLLALAPKALAVKEQILDDEEESRWLKNTVASDILDRTVARPSQNVNLRGAIVTASYTDEELRQILAQRILDGMVGEQGAQD